MLFPPHLSPNDQYKHLSYVGAVTAAQPLETFATWTIAALAAVTGLLLSHVDMLRHAMSASSLRWGIILSVVAMVFGALTKQFGIAIRTGALVTNSLYQHLHSPEGQSMLAGMTLELEKLPSELAQPFLQPIRHFIEKGARKGMADPLYSEKRLIKFLCIQIYLSYAMILSAAFSLLVLCCGIHEWA